MFVVVDACPDRGIWVPEVSGFHNPNPSDFHSSVAIQHVIVSLRHCVVHRVAPYSRPKTMFGLLTISIKLLKWGASRKTAWTSTIACVCCAPSGPAKHQPRNSSTLRCLGREGCTTNNSYRNDATAVVVVVGVEAQFCFVWAPHRSNVNISSKKLLTWNNLVRATRPRFLNGSIAPTYICWW